MKYPKFYYSNKEFSADNGDGYEVITIKKEGFVTDNIMIIADNSNNAMKLAATYAINEVNKLAGEMIVDLDNFQD